MIKHTVALSWGMTVAALLSGCGSIQLPRTLSQAERMELAAATIPAVVAVQPSAGEESEENLRRILDESGLFQRVALAGGLEREPDLLVVLTERCDRNPTTLVPMFTWLTLGTLPTWIRDGYGRALFFHAPGRPDERVVIGCRPDRTIAFGWLAIPLNVLPGWGLSDPEKHPRYANRLALEVARREAELRALLDP